MVRWPKQLADSSNSNSVLRIEPSKEISAIGQIVVLALLLRKHDL
jgi:hypothetical protein